MDIPKNKHPLEYMAKQHRAQNDIFAKLGQDELLITNFPKYERQMATLIINEQVLFVAKLSFV